jgi:hypothetical protein
MQRMFVKLFVEPKKDEKFHFEIIANTGRFHFTCNPEEKVKKKFQSEFQKKKFFTCKINEVLLLK